MLVKSENEITINVPSSLSEETLNDFYTLLDQIIIDKPKRLNLNCGQLEYANSRHVVTIWQAFSQCRDAGIFVRLTSVTVNLRQTLKILDLHEMFLGKHTIAEQSETKKLKIRTSLAPKVLKLEFPATIDHINNNMDRLRSYLNDLNINNLIVFELVTTFYEVVTNIRLHSDLDDNQLIKFTASSSKDAILMRFTDPGIEFNPIDNEKPYDPESAIKTGRKRGLGLTLVKRIADSMKYVREEIGLNTLTLVKKIHT